MRKAFPNKQEEFIRGRCLSSNQNILEMLNILLQTHHYQLAQKILSFIPVDLQHLIADVRIRYS